LAGLSYGYVRAELVKMKTPGFVTKVNENRRYTAIQLSESSGFANAYFPMCF
jgi:hypothetical protein